MEASSPPPSDLSAFVDLIPDEINTTFIARLLKIRRATVSEWVTSGKVPSVRKGKHTMIKKSDLIEFLKKKNREKE